MDKNEERRTRNATTEIVQLGTVRFAVREVQLSARVSPARITKQFAGLDPARKNLLILGDTKSVVVLAFAKFDRIAHGILTRQLD